MSAFWAACGAVLLFVLKAVLWVLGVLLALILLLVLIPLSVTVRQDKNGLWVRVRVLGIPIRVVPVPRIVTRMQERKAKKAEKAAGKTPAADAGARPGEKQPDAPKPEAAHAPQGETERPEKTPEAAAPAETAGGGQAARNEKEAAKGGKAAGAQQQNSARAAKKWKPTLDAVLQLASLAGGTVRLAFKGIWLTVWLKWPVQGADAADTALKYGRLNGWIGGAYATLRHVLQLRLKQLELVPDFMGAEKDCGRVQLRLTASLPVLLAAGIYLLNGLKKQKIL